MSPSPSLLNGSKTVKHDDLHLSEEPKTFDEVAKEIAKERGIVLEEKPLIPIPEDEPIVEEEQLSQTIIDEDNQKIRRIIKILEDKGWHPYVQKIVKLYVECAKNKLDIMNVDEAGKTYNRQSTFEFRYNEVDETLYFYQNLVNIFIKREDYNFSLRKKIILFLGCKCLFCGNEDIDYLQLDHKDNRGGSERKEFKKRGANPMLFYWNNLINAYFKLQVLCLKCHRLKSTGRITQREIDEKVKQESVKN